MELSTGDRQNSKFKLTKIVFKDDFLTLNFRVFNGLKEDLESKFNEAGALAKEDINLILNKFEELKSFVDTKQIHENIKATKTASTKLLKNLVEALKDLREASEDAAEKR